MVQDFPGLRAEQAGDGVERSRLAGAVGADERNDLAFVDMKRNTLQRLNDAVVNTQTSGLLSTSLVGPSHRTRPKFKTVRRSQIPPTSFISCSMRRIVMPNLSRIN